MRVIGLLNWFDEEPSWLAACVSSMSKLCSDVVAFDGAYGLFPTTDARSAPIQAETIARTADGLGMGWTIHTPQEKFWDGEVSKRAAMFAVARTFAERDDWFLVLDADEVLKDVWSGTRAQLSETDLDAAELTRVDSWGGRAPVRRLFRALPGITCETTHYTVVAGTEPNRVYLCGDPNVHNQVPSLSMLDLVVLDHGEERPAQRKAAKDAYYAKAMPIEQAALYGTG